MLAGASVTARSLELAGTTTSVLEAGNGPPMVLLHGAIECGGALWAPAIPALAKDYRLIVPDFPGLGESTPLPGIGLDSFAEWVSTLFERLDVVRPTLVAHSMWEAWRRGSPAGMPRCCRGWWRTRLPRLVVIGCPWL